MGLVQSSIGRHLLPSPIWVLKTVLKLTNSGGGVKNGTCR